MSHAYPLAANAKAALKTAAQAARTRYEAEALAEPKTVTALETEWLSLSEDALNAALEQASSAPGHGFLQRYEDASGNPVLAVTYWKLGPVKKAKKKKAPEPVPVAKPEETDDLYFKRRNPRGRRKAPDPNQLDLFGKPKEPEPDATSD